MGIANWLANTLSAQMSLFAPEPAVLVPPRKPAAKRPPKIAPQVTPLAAPQGEVSAQPGPTPESVATRTLQPPVATDFSALGPSQSTQTLQEALAPSRFAHPQANRRVELAGHQVHFLFRRGKRKTIGFLVGSDGLVVSAPRWVLVGDVDAAVREKGGWILRKLQEVQERHQHLNAQRIEWRDGAGLIFLGQPIVLVLDPRHAFSGSAQLEAAPMVLAHPAAESPPEPLAAAQQPIDQASPPTRLLVGLPHSATQEQIRDAVQSWLMRQAKRIFAERMVHFAQALGVTYTKLSLSSAGTRWGSASADGSIRLNWRLVHYKMSTIDYVVVHELSHLRVMDHSPRFWEVVGAVLPDYNARRAALKQDGRARWD